MSDETLSVSFAKYDGTGKFLFKGQVIKSMLGLQGDNIYEGEIDQATQYMKNGILKTRPVFTYAVSALTVAADTTEEVTISGLPGGALLTITGPTNTSGSTDGSDVILTFTTAGTYTISVELFPYQDLEVVINAS